VIHEDRVIFETARSERDFSEAFLLALKVFQPQSKIVCYETYKAMLWKEDPTYSIENLILAKDVQGKVVGLVRVVPRKLFRVNQQIRVAGISSVCIDEAYRGKGLSRRLVQYALELCLTRKFDIALLFARNAADHYYTKFGFWGVASYNKILVNLDNRRPSERNIKIDNARPELLPLYQKAYELSYARTFGRIERDFRYWDFIFKKLSNQPGLKLNTLICKGKPIGYAMISKGLIHELGYIDKPCTMELLNVLASENKSDPNSLILEISSIHCLLSDLGGLDVTLQARECNYGGHMLKILNVKRILRLMQRRLATGYKKRNIGPFSEQVEGISVEWNGQSCRVDATHIEASQIPYPLTCRLLGIASLTSSYQGIENCLPFNISMPDQF